MWVQQRVSIGTYLTGQCMGGGDRWSKIVSPIKSYEGGRVWGTSWKDEEVFSEHGGPLFSAVRTEVAQGGRKPLL